MKDEDFDLELDSDDMIDEYASEVNLILTILGKIDSDLAYSVVTNSSKFEDFDISTEEPSEVTEDLGFILESEHIVVDIAKKLRNNT